MLFTDGSYYTRNQKEHCPECGGKLRPLAFDDIHATTGGHGSFYACGNDCEYLELREVGKWLK